MHANLQASLQRLQALATGEPALGPVQRSAVYLFYGNRVLDQGQAPLAARLLQQSWELVPSPGRGTHAIVAWMMAEETDSARARAVRMRESYRHPANASSPRIFSSFPPPSAP